MTESGVPNPGGRIERPTPVPSAPGTLPLDGEPRRPVAESTLGPPGKMSKALWWMSYRVGRAMGKVLVKRTDTHVKG